MDVNEFHPLPHAAVIDLSFRSIVPVASRLLRMVSESWIVGLIKPQFEWHNPEKDFDGVIRSGEVLLDVLTEVLLTLYENKTYPVDLLESPIPGRKGNREFLTLFRGEGRNTYKKVVEKAKEILIK